MAEKNIVKEVPGKESSPQYIPPKIPSKKGIIKRIKGALFRMVIIHWRNCNDCND